MRTAKCNNSSKKDDIELFPGFKSAYEVTYIDWSDYSIDGVTYSESSTAYQIDSTVPGQTCLTSDSCCAASKISPVTNYKVENNACLACLSPQTGYDKSTASICHFTNHIKTNMSNIPCQKYWISQIEIWGKIYSQVDGGLYARMMPSTCVHFLVLTWALKGHNLDIRA